MRERHLSNARIHVHSPLKTTWGAGTSSALRLGVLLAAQHATSATTDSLTLAREAWALQRRQQREASGYDVATQITGGAIVFTPPSGRGLWPGAIASLPGEDLQRLSEHVHVVVGGRGAPTTATLGSTLEWIDQTAQAATIQSTQRELVDGFLGFARGLLSLETLCQSCERARRVFESSPRFPSEIKDALRQDSRSDSEWSWKTSGAGGEDALILIGKRDSLRAPLQTLARLGWMPLGIPFGGVPSVSTFTPSEDRS
jgi:mevalonate kinase